MEYMIFVDLTENFLIIASNKDRFYRVSTQGKINIQELSEIGIPHRVESSELGTLVFLLEENKPYEWGFNRL